MRRSKLQANVEILKTLAENGKLNSTDITHYTYLNNKSVKECLDFLIENNFKRNMNVNQENTIKSQTKEQKPENWQITLTKFFTYSIDVSNVSIK